MDESRMEQRVRTICLAILATLCVGAAIYWLQGVLIPFVLALFVSLAISPLVDLQIRWLRLPRPLALLTTLLAMLVLFFLVAMLVSTSLDQLARGSGDYVRQLSILFERLAGAIPDELDRWLPEEERAALLRVPVGNVRQLLAQTTNAILGLLSQSFLVFIFVTFLLVGGGEWSRRAEGTLGEIVRRVRRYLVVNVAISAVTGGLVTLTLGILGVPLATVFGLLAFLLNFIPNVGSIIATLLPLPVVIISPDVSSLAAVLAIALPAAIQMGIGNVVAPKVLGDSLDLHPVAVLMGLMLWGALWGIVGMLLATPIAVVVKILLEKFSSTRPLADLMAGRVESLLGSDRG